MCNESELIVVRANGPYECSQGGHGAHDLIENGVMNPKYQVRLKILFLRHKINDNLNSSNDLFYIISSTGVKYLILLTNLKFMLLFYMVIIIRSVVQEGQENLYSCCNGPFLLYVQ